MNFKKLIFGAAALLAVASSCQKKGDDGVKLEVDKAVVELAATDASEQLKILADCSWSARCDADWLNITPQKGSGNATVTVSALANTGVNRETVIKFQKSTTAKVYFDVTVKQAGEKGEDGAEEISIAEFIKRADAATEYIVEGTVVSIESNATGTYKAINITDGANTLCVFFPENFDDYKDVLKAGYTVRVKGKYEWYASKGLHELVKGTILEFKEGEAPAPAPAEEISIAEFIKRADTATEYIVEGAVVSLESNATGTYKAINITDGANTLCVFFPENFDDYKDVLKAGYTVRVKGKYEWYAAKSLHELVKGTILEFKEGEQSQDLTTSKISDVLAAADNTKVNLENVVVVAVSKQAYLVKDAESKYVLVYEGATPSETLPVVGDKVKVSATKATYSSMAQLSGPTTTKVGTETVSHPSATDISTGFDSFASSEVKYVSFKGTLAISGNYYNVTVDGATAKQGSISYPTQDLTSFANLPNCTYTGYYIYSTSSAKYVNIILTEVKAGEGKYLTVTPAASNVAATATSVALTVNANCAWTVASDNAAFTLDKTSGENGATVNVTFAANETETAKVANITFTYDGGKTATAKITQAAKSSGSDFTSSISWTLGTNSYSEKATVNETGDVAVLKLGTSKNQGSATLQVAAGTSKISFYAVGWKGGNYKVTLDGKEQAVAANDGATGNAPYTMTVSSTDHYVIDLGRTLTSAEDITITATGRVIVFGIK